jgi:hypothetical protein
MMQGKRSNPQSKWPVRHDDDDLEEIRRCVPRRCGVKLAAADIQMLTSTAAAGGSHSKPLLQQAFREMLLRRVLTVTGGGLPALDATVDKKRPSLPAESLGSIVDHTAFLSERLPVVAERLTRYAPHASSESFMYWSQERMGGRPVITIAHVTLIGSHDAH